MADIEADTLFTYSLGKGLYIFSEGPTGGPTNGSNSIYLNDVPLVDQNGVSSAEGVSWTWRGGTPDQEPVDGIPAAVSFQNVGVEVKKGVPYAVTIANGSDNYDAAYVVVGIPRLVFTSSKGNLRKTRLSYTVDVKANGGAWVTQHSVNLDAKASAPWEGTYRVELPAGGSPWQVRLNRITDNADDGPRSNGETYDNRTRFERYATITDGRFNYRNTALLGIQYDSKKYGTSIPNVKVLMNGIKCYVPKNYNPLTRVYATTGTGTSNGIWDGTFKQAVTDNPFWIYHDLVVNNRYGLGQDFNPDNDPESAFVDKWALYSLAQYADEMVSNGQGGTEPRFTLNTQITNKAEAYDVLQNIIASANGMLYFSADQVVAVADRPQAVSDAFTQADVEGGFFEYSGTALKARHSVCIVNYKDPDNLYKTSNVVYEDGDYIDEIGYRATEITAFGCTSRAQAMRLAKWTLRTERTQTQTVTFKTGHRGGLLKPGDVIKVFDDYKTGTRTGGRILSSAATSNTSFTLDAPVTVTNADKILYMDATGTLQEFSLLASSGNTVTVSGVKPLPIDGAMFAIVYASLDGQQYRILSVEESQDDGKYIVSGLLHDPQKFAFVDDNVIIAPPVTSVLGADALSPITVGHFETYYEEVSGAQSTPKVTFAWQPPVFPNTYSIAMKRGQVDERISGYEFQLKTPWDDYKEVYTGNGNTWTSGPLEVVADIANDEENPLGYKYGGRVRAVDQLGRKSRWFVFDEFFLDGKDKTPDPVIGLTATPVVNGIALSWDNPVLSDFKHVTVKVNTTNDENTATKIAEISDDFYILSGIGDDNARYFFLNVVTHSQLNNVSATRSTNAIRGKVQQTDLAPTAGFIQTVNGLPNPGTWTGSNIVYDTVTGQLYRLTGGAWVAVVGSSTTQDVLVGAPSGLVLSSTLAIDAAQQNYITLNASWSAPGDVTNLAFYEIELQEGSGPVFIFPASSPSYTRLVRPNTVYTARVRSVSKTANRSAWTGYVAHTSTGDVTPPAAPTSLVVTASLGSLFLLWTNASDSDLDTVEVWANTSNNSGTATRVGTVNALPSASGAFTYGGLTTGDYRYFWLKSVDTSGNVSGFSANVLGIIPSLNVTDFASTIKPIELFASHAAAGTGTLGRTYFNTSDGKLYRGQGSSWSAAVAGSDIAANSITAGQIQAGAISATEIAANAITSNKIGAQQIYAGHIVAGTITSNEIQANSISGDRISTTTTLPGSIIVGGTGVSIYTTAINADDPAARINASAVTSIIPGRILISGGTTLADWRQGGDNTRIAGGQISANTITANKLTIGNRGISVIGCEFEYNNAGTLSWRQGYILYPDDAGNMTSAFINAGSTTWTGGSFKYVYWPKGGAFLGTGVDNWPTIMSGDNIIMCTWANGASFVANYGGTIVNGDNITTGSINAAKITSFTITANQIAGGTITGDRIAGNTITGNNILAGTITAAHIQVGSLSADRIQTGSISATQLTLNGVTFDRLAYGSSGKAAIYYHMPAYNVYPGNWTAVCGVGVTPLAGSPVIGTFTFIAQTLTGETGIVTFQVRRVSDGTVVWGHGSGITADVEVSPYGRVITGTFFDSTRTSAGRQQYDVYVYAYGATTQFTQRTMTLRELARENFDEIQLFAPADSGVGPGTGSSGGGNINGDTYGNGGAVGTNGNGNWSGGGIAEVLQAY